jgi:hypothetical protein
MSIATLKKKSRQMHHTMSTNQKEFSINGTHRSQGWVGQTMLSRSLPRTPHRGVEAQGHGGCCGKYADDLNIVSGICDRNDPTYVKSSVLDTNGMLMLKYRWIRRPAPFTSVKPDSNVNNQNQSTYITHRRSATLAEVNSAACKARVVPGATAANQNCELVRPKYNNLEWVTRQCRITKTVGPVDQSTHLTQVVGGCSELKLNPLPVQPGNHTAFGC